MPHTTKHIILFSSSFSSSFSLCILIVRLPSERIVLELFSCGDNRVPLASWIIFRVFTLFEEVGQVRCHRRVHKMASCIRRTFLNTSVTLTQRAFRTSTTLPVEAKSESRATRTVSLFCLIYSGVLLEAGKCRSRLQAPLTGIR